MNFTTPNKTWNMQAPGAPLKTRNNQMNDDPIWNEDNEAGYFDVDGFYTYYTQPAEYDIPQHNLNTLFEILFKPLDDPLFVPTPHLEQLDKDLSEAYEKYIEEKDMTDDNRDCIETYKNEFNISASEAFELLRRCHYCGSTEMKFGEEYCSQICDDNHMDHPCYWNCECATNCKICKHNEEAFILRR